MWRSHWVTVNNTLNAEDCCHQSFSADVDLHTHRYSSLSYIYKHGHRHTHICADQMAASQRVWKPGHATNKVKILLRPAGLQGCGTLLHAYSLCTTSLNISKALVVQMYLFYLPQKTQNKRGIMFWISNACGIKSLWSVMVLDYNWIKNACLNPKQLKKKTVFPVALETAGYFRSFLSGAISYYSWLPPSSICSFHSWLVPLPIPASYLSILFSSCLFDSFLHRSPSSPASHRSYGSGRAVIVQCFV